MTPEQFKLEWETAGDMLCRFYADELQGLGLKSQTVDFLKVAGLPGFAEPFLSFVQNDDDQLNRMRRLRDVYEFLGEEFEKYVLIGWDGVGDPIVVNIEENDAIESLDHESGFSSYYFNSSISTMAECLLVQRNFVDLVDRENGPESYSNSNFTDAQFETLKTGILAVDPDALQDDGFWKVSLEVELTLRDGDDE